MADIRGSYDDLFTAVPTALAVQLDDGDADLDLAAPVARFWPEFAAAGKEQVLVRHLLAHTAGLPDWNGPIEELYDWPSATARPAGQEPLWEPGSAAGYHSLTQGFLVGEVVRRITGRSVGAFFAAEVAAPLGADFSIGLPAEHDSRVALSVPPPGQDEDYTASAAGGAPSPGTAVRVRDGNSMAWRRAQVPAVNGFGNARSVALVQSVPACGGAVDGVRLLSPAGADRAREEQFDGEDRRLGMPVRWGLG